MKRQAPHPRTLPILLLLLLVVLATVVAMTSTRPADAPVGAAVTAELPETGAANASPEAEPPKVGPAPRTEATAPRTQTPEAPAAGRAGEAGMIVGIDPETGQIGLPNEEQRRALDEEAARQPQLSRSMEGLAAEHRPDGTVHLNLQGRFQEYVTVRIGPDGEKIFGCVGEPSSFAIETAPAPARPVAAEVR